LTPPSYADLNPLIVPKLLLKPLFVKEFVLEKAPPKEEDFESTVRLFLIKGKERTGR
jgi:hypothetical protein